MLLSGNEAIARGAWDAGCKIGVAYPGTPSTETLENFALFDGVYAEWCVNEKVAVEVGVGASAAGARVLATMKHVGVNVASDPLYSCAYTGVNAGFVILGADDPGIFSSQNEQDTNYHGSAAHVPVLSPADSQEAYDFTRQAFDFSERFDVPVIIRSTTRISHTKTVVELSEHIEKDLLPYEKNIKKWVLIPAFSRPLRIAQLKRIEEMEEWSNTSDLNSVSIKDTSIGVICAGAAYQHVVEALPNASILKLGITYPVPKQKIRDFAKLVDKLYVVEEGSTYLLEAVCASGVVVDEAPFGLPKYGELSDGIIKKAFYGVSNGPQYTDDFTVPNRPPALCSGCPHRVVFKELNRMKAIVTGDIGCYTLGSQNPLSAIDTVVDMGASVSMSHGMELAFAFSDKEHRPVVGIIGDSTFAHSGLSSLMSTAYNKGVGTICILDNRTTAMTGRQGNPFNGVTLQGRESREMDIAAVVSALGIEDVQTIDPYDVKAVRSALKAAVAHDDLSVLIFKAPCVLLERKTNPTFTVTADCKACSVCLTLGCPALSKDQQSDVAVINPLLCYGCGQCSQYCNFNAITRLNDSVCVY